MMKTEFPQDVIAEETIITKEFLMNSSKNISLYMCICLCVHLYVYLHMCIHASITLSRQLLVKTDWNAGLKKLIL